MTKAHEQPVARTANDIEEEAALWLIRTDGPTDPEQWAKLDSWLNANTRHRAAFLRLSVAWRRADALQKLARLGDEIDEDILDPHRWAGHEQAHAEALVPPVPAVVTPPSARVAALHYFSANDQASSTAETVEIPRLSRRRILSWTHMPVLRAAAAVLATVVVALVAWRFVGPTPGTHYATAIGEFRRVTLDDGSVIGLNTSSEVVVRYSAGAREISLLRGEALFTVAHDVNRPFDVSAGSLVVRAVGTEFSVRMHDSQSLDLLVSEGRVAINPPSNTTLAAGTAAALRDGRLAMETLTPGDITRKLSWTTGRLSFQSATLASMASEFNRYNSQRLLISDPDLARQRFGGTFRATDPNAFASALEHTFHIKVSHATDADGSDVIRLDRGVP